MMLTLLPGDESTTWNDDMASGRTGGRGGSLQEENTGMSVGLGNIQGQ